MGQQRVGCRPCTTGDDCEDSNPCTTDLCNDISRACDYLLVTGCVPDGGDAGPDGGDADGGDADTDASIDGSDDSTVPTPDARSDGRPGDASSGGSGGSGGSGENNATYKKDDYGSCACRVPGRPRSGGAASLLLLALAGALLVRHRRRS
jgi:MYXO-CTERM domain-containing protein